MKAKSDHVEVAIIDIERRSVPHRLSMYVTTLYKSLLKHRHFHKLFTVVPTCGVRAPNHLIYTNLAIEVESSKI